MWVPLGPPDLPPVAEGQQLKLSCVEDTPLAGSDCTLNPL
jgi:hypothetical protein